MIKRYLSFLFVLIFLASSFIINALAQGDYFEPITFLESTENMQNLKSYRLNQNLTGHFETDDDPTGNELQLTGEYRLKVNMDVLNRSPYEIDTYSFVRGHLYVYADGPKRPFERLEINFRGELIGLADEGLYVRLNTFNLNADGVPEDEMENYLEFKNELDQKLYMWKGFWTHYPKELCESRVPEGLPEELRPALNPETTKNNLQDKGIKEAYEQILMDLLGGLTVNNASEDLQETVVEKFLATNFFIKKPVLEGGWTGFMNFTLNKRRIAEFMVWMARELGESPTEDDIKELWDILNKFYFSYMTHSSPDYKVIDFLRFKLILHDLETWNQLSFNYSCKIGKINEIEPIEAPDEFVTFLGCLPFQKWKSQNAGGSDWGSESDESDF